MTLNGWIEPFLRSGVVGFNSEGCVAPCSVTSTRISLISIERFSLARLRLPAPKYFVGDEGQLLKEQAEAHYYAISTFSRDLSVC